MSQDLRLVLYAALAEPIGLLVQCSPDFATARQRLYAARKAAGDPALEVLQFRASPGLEGGNLIIVKRTVEAGASADSGSDS